MALRSSRSRSSWLRGVHCSPTIRMATKPGWPVARIQAVSCSLTGRYRCSSAGSHGFKTQPSKRPSVIAWLIGWLALRSQTPRSTSRLADGCSSRARASSSRPVMCGIHWSAMITATATWWRRSRSSTWSAAAGVRSARIW
jgi:hypothetical protein